MRRILVAVLIGLFLVTTAAMTGCGSREKAQIPEKEIELPKEGPTPVGVPSGAPGKSPSAD